MRDLGDLFVMFVSVMNLVILGAASVLFVVRARRWQQQPPSTATGASRAQHDGLELLAYVLVAIFIGTYPGRPLEDLLRSQSGLFAVVVAVAGGAVAGRLLLGWSSRRILAVAVSTSLGAFVLAAIVIGTADTVIAAPAANPGLALALLALLAATFTWLCGVPRRWWTNRAVLLAAARYDRWALIAMGAGGLFVVALVVGEGRMSVIFGAFVASAGIFVVFGPERWSRSNGARSPLKTLLARTDGAFIPFDEDVLIASVMILPRDLISKLAAMDFEGQRRALCRELANMALRTDPKENLEWLPLSDEGLAVKLAVERLTWADPWRRRVVIGAAFRVLPKPEQPE